LAAVRAERAKMEQSSSLSFVATQYKWMSAFSTGIRRCPFRSAELENKKAGLRYAYLSNVVQEPQRSQK
jgi:hypothetical protein